MTTATFNAWYFVNKASIDLLSASTLEDNGLGGSVYTETAIKNLSKAADALGLELVEKAPLKRVDKEAYIARVMAVAADDRIGNGGMKSDVNGNLYQRD